MTIAELKERVCQQCNDKEKAELASLEELDPVDFLFYLASLRNKYLGGEDVHL